MKTYLSGYREKAAVELAHAAALAGLRRRSINTRLFATKGVCTREQRHAQTAVVRALALTDDAQARKPTRDNLKEARADGAVHACAAQQNTIGRECRLDIAAAIENARLNKDVDAAAEAGKSNVIRALEAGDSEAARRCHQ